MAATAAPRRPRSTGRACSRHFRHARKLLDDFRPEVVVIWGDDQHENFTEDIIPPFCVLAYDQIEARHRTRDAGNNVWGEGAGHRAPDPGASRGRQVPRAAASRAGHRRVVRLRAAAPSRARACLPQHDPVPRLRPRGVPLPGGRVPGELLRPARDRPARLSRPASSPRSPTPSSTRPRRRRSGAWRRARRWRARCGRAPGARR